MSKGILYIGTALSYLEEAKISAQSVREHNDIPIAIVTTDSLEQRAERYSIFDEIITINQAQLYDDVRDKVEYMAETPFNKTLYLDGDTYVLGDISPAFDILSQVDLAAAHEPVRPIVTISSVPETFPELNTGVVCFSSSDKISDFFKQWKKNLQNQINHGRPNETVTLGSASTLDEIPFGRKHGQPPFRETLYHSDLQFAALPTEYNFRGSVWAYDDVKIVHRGHGDIGSFIKEVVNDAEGGRTYVRKTKSLYFIHGPTVRFYNYNNYIKRKIHNKIYYSNMIRKLISKTGTKKYIKKLYRHITE